VLELLKDRLAGNTADPATRIPLFRHLNGKELIEHH
jgi:hypothetical protein